MSIKFAAIVPHPPVLIPAIGKENRERLKNTIQAYAVLADEIKAKRIQTILIISPHGTILDSAMALNQNFRYQANFEEFGDFGTKPEWDGHPGLAQKLKAPIESNGLLRFYTSEALDHGAAIPLVMLAEKLKNLRIIPLTYSGLDNSAHLEFGRQLQPTLMKTRERVAVIASGDLSHRLTKDAPGGYSPRGKKFDNKLKELLKTKNTAAIAALPPDLVSEASECGLKSILILLGILDGLDYEPRPLSYESPFGVGYLVMNFVIGQS